MMPNTTAKPQQFPNTMRRPACIAAPAIRAPEKRTPNGKIAVLFPLADLEPDQWDRPKLILFPDGSVRRLSYWNDLIVQTALYLWETERLTLDLLPVKRNGSRHIANKTGVHSNGRHFVNPKWLSGNLFAVETNVDRYTSVKCAIELLVHCAIDPLDVHVEMR